MLGASVPSRAQELFVPFQQRGRCETLEQAGIPPGFPKVPGPGWGAVWEGRANGDVWQMESAVIM